MKSNRRLRFTATSERPELPFSPSANNLNSRGRMNGKARQGAARRSDTLGHWRNKPARGNHRDRDQAKLLGRRASSLPCRPCRERWQPEEDRQGVRGATAHPGTLGKGTSRVAGGWPWSGDTRHGNAGEPHGDLVADRQAVVGRQAP